MKVSVTVNGLPYRWDVELDEYLLDTLRKNHFYSVKRGCDTTSCGVCTVLIDNKPVPSCSYLSVRVDGCNITTVEGIKEEAKALAEAFGEEGADQCGYCNPSLALMVYALKKEISNPTDEEIRSYLVGNLCRCSGYEGQHRAIKKYLGLGV